MPETELQRIDFLFKANKTTLGKENELSLLICKVVSATKLLSPHSLPPSKRITLKIHLSAFITAIKKETTFD